MEKMRGYFCLFGCQLLLFTNSIAQKSSVIEVYSEQDSSFAYFVRNHQLFNESWDTLAQPNFWKIVMATHEDSCIVNVASTRQVLFSTSYTNYKKKSTAQKSLYKDSIRKAYCLDYSTKIYLTSGKRAFYDFEKVMPSISKGV